MTNCEHCADDNGGYSIPSIVPATARVAVCDCEISGDRCDCRLTPLCRSCAASVAEWKGEMWAEEHAYRTSGDFDGPYFADTMSGGCIEL